LRLVTSNKNKKSGIRNWELGIGDQALGQLLIPNS
jgi:hypothetical protein